MQSMSLWRYTVELNFEGVFCRWPIFCLWGHFVVSLRTADACSVVASLPPKNREKRRPEMRLLFAGYLKYRLLQATSWGGWGGALTDLHTSRCFNSTSHKFSIEAVFKASEASFNGRRPSERQGREVRTFKSHFVEKV